MQKPTLYIERVRLKDPAAADPATYPYTIPAIARLGEIRFRTPVTFFVGENGMGKSTLIEAIAIQAGYNPEGGSKNFNFSTQDSHSELHRNLVISRTPRISKDGYFLRAESYYNVASEIDRLDSEPGGPPIRDYYGGRSLHRQSHGESFMSLITNRFYGNGLYILDEPEAALSPARQLQLLARMHQLVRQESQFLIATHSPLLMAYPHAEIYRLGHTGIEPVRYQETDHYTLTKYFLNNPGRVLAELLADDRPE